MVLPTELLCVRTFFDSTNKIIFHRGFILFYNFSIIFFKIRIGSVFTITNNFEALNLGFLDIYSHNLGHV